MRTIKKFFELSDAIPTLGRRLLPLLLLLPMACGDDESTVAVTGVTVSPATQTLTVGDTQQFTASVTPADATDKTVAWTSSSTAIATVSDGLVTAVAPGTATITATAGGKTGTATVTVEAKVVPVTGVTVDSETKTLNKGDTFTASVTVMPENATNKAVTWSSNAEAIASVGADGLIVAREIGTATITVTTSEGGFTATVSITVEKSAAEKAAELAAALGTENVLVSGDTVILTGDISTAEVTVAEGITLKVPVGKTLTLSGTLTLNGAINVEGTVDVAGRDGTGTANLLSGSKSKGLVAAPANAVTGWIWTFGSQNWSDRIAIAACKDDSPSIGSTDAHCGTRISLDNLERYHYNWYYVSAASSICGSGWSLPENHRSLNENTTRDHLWNIWGLGGSYGDWGFSSNSDNMADGGAARHSAYWTSTPYPEEVTQHIIFIGSWGIQFDDQRRSKSSYLEVRCVSNND